MRICMFGAGAVGGNLGVRLAAAGYPLSVVARGPTLDAIRQHGWRLIAGDQQLTARVAASDDPAELGVHDVVIVTVKAHQLDSFAAIAPPLLGPATLVVFAQNGIPWWYSADTAGSILDPDGVIEHTVGRARSIGAVVYSANSVEAPGLVRNDSVGRNRLLLGAIGFGASERLTALQAALATASIESPATADLRAAVWRKLIANVTVSVPALLAGRSSREVFDDPVLGPEGAAIAAELVQVAQADGVTIDASRPRPAAGHSSSLLQDARAGRPLETAALLDAPQAIARARGISTPRFDQLCERVRQRVQANARGTSSPAGTLSEAL
ncbi:ketopantoate reductase family protein [Sphingomonas baiyangensis]|uniref:2-dehydropantoate 2-reductase n=1 Tax=Sphingomonas baiyangensis TaxID=2572576 RepID=A0A4U1L5M6_9SPHN|nr:2-dehydropantoate 2-reductase [Sphingomonas baiyangensis]TKD51570.1 2-dehydropantoate 2-reductase [Sphingomonas baiyangensis]